MHTYYPTLPTLEEEVEAGEGEGEEGVEAEEVRQLECLVHALQGDHQILH